MDIDAISENKESLISYLFFLLLRFYTITLMLYQTENFYFCFSKILSMPFCKKKKKKRWFCNLCALNLIQSHPLTWLISNLGWRYLTYCQPYSILYTTCLFHYHLVVHPIKKKKKNEIAGLLYTSCVLWCALFQALSIYNLGWFFGWLMQHCLFQLFIYGLDMK